MNAALEYLTRLNKLQYGLLCIAGLSFWFFLGFPFEIHAEYGTWVELYNKFGLYDWFTTLMPPTKTHYQPLAQAVSWLAYNLHKSIYTPQVYNYLGTILAWLILFTVIKEKILFSWLSLIVGGTFFSGYKYLFIPAITYTFIFIYLALLLAMTISDHNKKHLFTIIIISILGVVASLHHIFGLMLYVAFMAGYFLENFRTLTRNQLIIGLLFIIILPLVLIEIQFPGQAPHLTGKKVAGFLLSYKLLELTPALSVLSWLLSIVTIISLNTSNRLKLIFSGITTSLSFIFIWLNWPVLIVWIAVCILKSALMWKWSIVFILITAAIFPIGQGSGSPIYAIFVPMVCTFITALGSPWLKRESVPQSVIASIVLILIASTFILLKAEVQLPVISKLANPLLAEKEKAFQMKNIIEWMLASDYKGGKLVLCQEWERPVKDPKSAIERTKRPPSSQLHLDIYMNWLQQNLQKNTTEQLWVCFGGEKLDGAKRIYTVPGKYNGEATVWVRNQ